MGNYIHLNSSRCVYICIAFSFLIWLPDKMENQYFSDFYLTDAIICVLVFFLLKKYPFLILDL